MRLYSYNCSSHNEQLPLASLYVEFILAPFQTFFGHFLSFIVFSTLTIYQSLLQLSHLSLYFLFYDITLMCSLLLSYYELQGDKIRKTNLPITIADSLILWLLGSTFIPSIDMHRKPLPLVLYFNH